MKLIIFGILQFVVWTAFYTTIGLLKDEKAILAALAVSLVATITMLAIVIKTGEK